MRTRPKTLPASASVADARESFENNHIVTALLVDEEGRFIGSVDREAIPPTAGGDEPALDYASPDTPTAAATSRV